MTKLYVGHGVKITLNFELRLDSGEVVDSTFDKAPGTFEFGDGTLPAGFEELMRGMASGERKIFQVKPEQGFGMQNPQNLQTFRREDFSHLDTLEPGMVMSFADAAKAELPGVVAKVSDDEVIVDFNHPLAGRHLEFEVEIIELSEMDGEA
ncbi:peptidylprolyl isomerase [Hahella sp. CCB-MM4]|uniref:FKBP-type peptidyl-prolyl cis-trans isomerase n=1 Tax=Hahella sp. (strain CCB-MM4) TaxID=1926491 RepID=UPI000B9B20E8|nr:FKBP-type peptidyl-prolyl cis-trans isomerase [Hahella sp. CCB-MM4]OZG71471.1 peptidylprolyl isomerase [Hahella sp. CCB-MM4]